MVASLELDGVVSQERHVYTTATAAAALQQTRRPQKRRSKFRRSMIPIIVISFVVQNYAE
jgi:hypothetical protein